MIAFEEQKVVLAIPLTNWHAENHLVQLRIPVGILTLQIKWISFDFHM